MQLASKQQNSPMRFPSPTYRTKGYAFLLPFSPPQIVAASLQARAGAQKDHTQFANLSPSFLSSFLFYNPSNLQLPLLILVNLILLLLHTP